VWQLVGDTCLPGGGEVAGERGGEGDARSGCRAEEKPVRLVSPPVRICYQMGCALGEECWERKDRRRSLRFFCELPIL